MTVVRLSRCVLGVVDVAEALAFYRDVLGFEVRSEPGWVSVSPRTQPELQIVLAPVDHHTEGHLVFTTDDCDATFAHLEAAGAEVMQEPITQPSGTRDCAFADPSGNLLHLTQG
ncbi:VOC family protein [Asanoa sp. NPDC049573]|uniref:VOC family protein n=1 Tax=Asanoa sp. NPDC049573 TaxID=3155396 RepID=UPI00341A02BA